MIHVIGVPSVSAQSFTVLGSLASHPEGISTAHGVSDDGSVVIGYSSSGSFENEAPREAFRWTSGGMTGLGTLRNGFASQAYAVSGDGSTVVGQSRQSNFEAFRWTSGEGMKRLNLGINMSNGDAKGVSANGDVVVGYAVGSGTRVAFRWTENGVTMLPAIRTGARTEATAVSADGSVVVGFSDSQITRWQGGAVTALGPGFAQGVSADGSIVVGYNIDEGRQKAFTWTTETGIVPLAGFPGGSTRANDVSDDGTIVVGEASVPGMSDSPLAAAVWTPDGTVRLLKDILEDQGLDLTGWTLRTATGVSADGRVIVGFGINPNGSGEAWRAEILPIVVDEIVVNSTADEPNDPISLTSDVCDVDREEPGDQCTLRAAIELANARGGGTIVFDIPGEGVPSIKVFVREETDALPPFISPIVLDATTQPGGWVEITGSNAESLGIGISLEQGASRSEVRGLVINGFSVELLVATDDCLIEGNRIGTDVTGTEAFRWKYGPLGLLIRGDSNRLVDNVVAGHWGQGEFFTDGLEVWIQGDDNVLEGNRIGIGADGLVIPGGASGFNTFHTGIFIEGDRNIIGGGTTTPMDACTSPCNIVAGVETAVALGDHPPLQFFEHVVNNEVLGNWLGVDATGTPVFPVVTSTQAAESRGVIDGVEAEGSIISFNRIHASGTAVGAGRTATVVGNDLHGRPDATDAAFYGATTGLLMITGPDAEVRGNTIRSYSARGVVIQQDVSAGEGRNTLAENTIAENPLGGILVLDGTGHIVADNEIHDNGLYGVNVLGTAFGQSREPGALITRNRIYDNGIGIDLGSAGGGDPVPVSPWGYAILGNGVTLNDVSDIDQGPNGLLNFPVPLQVSRLDRFVSVEGVLWGAFSGEYVVEVFANTKCSEASIYSRNYGAGEHYLGSMTVTPGVLDAGEPAFTFVEGGLEDHHRYISLTSSRVDLGITSEFSQCVWMANAEDVAREDVEAGPAGKILDAVSVVISVANTINEKRTSSTVLQDGGTIYATRYETAPDPSLFADTTALAPGGSRVRPEAVAARHWYLADRGLTAASGEAEDGSLAFEVCLDPTGVVIPASLAEVVLVQRSDATEGQWQPHDTYSHDHNGTTYLCATGLSALGEFSIGGAEDALPTSIQEPDREVPGRISLGQNYPNPFNPQTVIPFDLNAAGNVKIEVYDMLGRHVQTLVNATMPAGRHKVSFDAGRLSSGIYIYRLEAGSERITRKMMMIR